MTGDRLSELLLELVTRDDLSALSSNVTGRFSFPEQRDSGFCFPFVAGFDCKNLHFGQD